MENTFQLTVDIKKERYLTPPRVTSNDNVLFIVTVTDNGIAVDLANIVTAEMAHVRPDRQVVRTPGVINGDGTIHFSLNGTAAHAREGEVKGKVQLIDAEGRVSSAALKYYVERDPDNYHIPTGDQRTLIQVALEDGPLILNAAEDVTARAETLIIENETTFLPAVETVALRDSTYPNPVQGDTVRVTGTGTMYRFQTGDGWVITDKYAQSAVDEITAQLADIAHVVSSFKEPTDVDDTASINRALAYVNTLGGGKVRIPFRTNQYVISSPLVIHSNTTLEVDKYAKIVLGGGSNCVMLENANMSIYTNMTRVDENIKIIGGIWEGNGANQPLKWYGAVNSSQLVVGFMFSGVTNLEFKPTLIRNPKSYGALFCNVRDLLVENVELDIDLQQGNEDGFHVLGPAENITIQNCKIRSHDNFIAINANDVDHGPYTTLGDIRNVRIDNITVNNYDGGQGMLLLSGAFSVKDVKITNITGEAAYLINIHTFDMGAGDFDNIVLDGINLKRNNTIPFPYINMFGQMGSVDLKNIKREDDSGTLFENSIKIKTTPGTPVTIIDKLTIENLDIGKTTVTNAGIFHLVDITDGAVVNDLTVDGVRSKANNTPIVAVNVANSTVKNFIVKNSDVDNAPYGAVRINDSTIEKMLYDNVRVDLLKSVNKLTYINSGAVPNLGELIMNNCGNIHIGYTTKIDRLMIDGRRTSANVPSDAGNYRIGEVVYSSNPVALGYVGWVCTVAGSPYNVQWVANTAYEVGDIVRSGNWLIKAIVAGTSGSSITVVDGDFVDGTVTWRYMFDAVAQFKLFGALQP